MSDYLDHARRHAPGGSDPISAGISDMFVVNPASTMTINDGAHAFITLDTASVSIGSPFTSPDDQEFDLAAGAWSVGFQVGASGGGSATSGFLMARILDSAQPAFVATARFVKGTAVNVASDYNISGASLIDGRTNPPVLFLRVDNSLGYQITIGNGVATFLWGVRLIST